MSDEWEYVSPPIKRIATITADGTVIVHDAAALVARIAQLEAALRSIAANGCCDRCQEAALVARAALAPKEPP